jgi:hypothetical protein
MQLECSDESLACSVGLQSTLGSAIRATVEGREILTAANSSAAVVDNGDTCVITTRPAFASDVCAGQASRLAHGDGRVQLRGQPLSFSDCARDPAFSRPPCARRFRQRAQWGRNGFSPDRRRADRRAGIADT